MHNSALEPQMLLNKSTKKTKKFLRKTFRNLTSLFLEGYQKLPKSPSLNPFTSCSTSRKNRQTDEYYDQWEADMDKNSTMLSKDPAKEEEGCSEGLEKTNPPKSKQEAGGGKKQKTRGSYNGEINSTREPSSRSMTTAGDGHELAQKMKELDMIDEGDMEHVLDIEEAIHYYSRLRSPVYLDIVDNFFMDMYSEFNIPQQRQKQPSALSSLNNSKRRKGSFRL